MVHNVPNISRPITIQHARGHLKLLRTRINHTKIQVLNWIKPPSEFYKLNTDASYDSNSNSSYGGILRNHVGKMIFSYFGPMVATSPLEAEFIAMLIGCRIYKLLNLDFGQLILESDNQTMVESINSSNCILFNHLNHWLEMLTYTKEIHLIKHTFRETNAVADLLAKQGKTTCNFTIYFAMSMLTHFCRNYILLDQWSVLYVKVSIKK
jgi:ribonuclease HI